MSQDIILWDIHSVYQTSLDILIFLVAFRLVNRVASTQKTGGDILYYIMRFEFAGRINNDSKQFSEKVLAVEKLVPDEQQENTLLKDLKCHHQGFQIDPSENSFLDFSEQNLITEE
ncbi:hypothetical protein CDAR_393011 [Caerostris darwini]|uniref:Uncharacterized protein n=1 Tax=Caerostris darwini TaxID=1538125 RepID=A0AAV4PYT7_9ARAC|nr:hypothetical protein CDAR_393011 [Caerostris darwini]